MDALLGVVQEDLGIYILAYATSISSPVCYHLKTIHAV